VATALAEANIKLVPDVLVNGANGGLIDGFVATLMKPKSKDVVLASPSSAT
jgi:hypothetical protein